MTEKKLRQFSGMLPAELLDRVKLKADREGRTLTGILAECFNDYVKEGDLQEQIDHLKKRLDELEKKVQSIKK